MSTGNDTYIFWDSLPQHRHFNFGLHMLIDGLSRWEGTMWRDTGLWHGNIGIDWVAEPTSDRDKVKAAMEAELKRRREPTYGKLNVVDDVFHIRKLAKKAAQQEPPHVA